MEEEEAELGKEEKPDMFYGTESANGVSEGLYDSFLPDAPSACTFISYLLLRAERLQTPSGALVQRREVRTGPGPIEFRARDQ